MALKGVQLATLADRAPQGAEWIHELKHDGYRLQVEVRPQGRIRLLTRNNNDWTARFAPFAKMLRERFADSAQFSLDGELVAALRPQAEPARGNFSLLQKVVSEGQWPQLIFYAFDLLSNEGADLRGLPLRDRQSQLDAVLARGRGRRGAQILRRGPVLQKDGTKALAWACRNGFEGIVSKRLDAPYRAGRGEDWLKVKCSRRQELVIGGYTRPRGARVHFGALLVGYFADGQFKYAGKVGTGFDVALLGELKKKMDRLRRTQSPFGEAVRGDELITWLAPKLVAEIDFTEFTPDGRLRHPVFMGLREDKDASRVVREEPRVKAKPRGARKLDAKPEPLDAKTKSAVPVRLTHPDKMLFPRAKLSKADLARYFAKVAPLMLPFAQDRLLMIKRCNDGQGGPCFFQKHGGPALPEGLRAKPEGLVVDDARGLGGLAQINALEVHGWGSRAGKAQNPDLLVFDLDPDEKLPWAQVVSAAQELRVALKKIKLQSFPKLSGGKGIHVVVPLQDPGLTWKRTKDFAQEFARDFETRQPARYLAEASKAQRRGKIFIDYLRNARGATAVLPYSPRAQPEAPVAMPLSWALLAKSKSSRDWTVARVLKTARLPRPWAKFATTRQKLPAKR